MIVNSKMKIMNYDEWLRIKFLEWEKNSGRRQTVTAFARYLKVKQPSLERWMNGDNPPSLKYIQILGSKLGHEIYDILGLPRPNTIPLDQLPKQVRDRLTTAIYEVNSELDSRGISVDSSEAENIAIETLEKHGFKYTKTIIK